jgi:DNA polymerase-1
MLTNLREIAEPTSELYDFTDLMLSHRREAKLYGTYVKGIRKRMLGGKVFPTFLLHGTVTGRLACRNPNLQNVPRESKIRRQFVPRPGHIFIQADYSQVELRVITTLAQDEYLRGVFLDESRDIHGEVATQFYGDGWTKEQRVRAKAVVYGLSYGREAFGLAQEFKIPVAEAQRYLDTFFGLIPGVVAWRDDVKRRILTGEGLSTPTGRKRRFWLITDDNKLDVLKEGWAYLPQSIASDICLQALVRMRPVLAAQGVEVKLPVHDSILVECPIDLADDVAQYMRQTMEQSGYDIMGDYVKFAVDIEKGVSWGDLK